MAGKKKSEKDNDSEDDCEKEEELDDEGSRAWELTKRVTWWLTKTVAFPVGSIAAAAGMGGYFCLTHAEEIQTAIYNHQREKALENAPEYRNILSDLRERNAVHRRYDMDSEIREGVEGICREIDSVDGYRCSRTYDFPLGRTLERRSDPDAGSRSDWDMDRHTDDSRNAEDRDEESTEDIIRGYEEPVPSDRGGT